jgi:guanylate kinase
MNNENQPTLNPPTKPLLIVLSGLSGAGKDAVLSKLKESGFPLEYITTVTTRPRRADERPDIDYRFISREDFEKMIERDELLEWANVYGNFYGVPREPVRQALGRGKDTIVKVDVQGVANIKNILPQAVFIFVTPPSIEEVVSRLKRRHTESPADLARRIRTAEEELKQLPLFDYIVLNRQDEIERAAADIIAIITAEKLRLTPREIAL